MVRRAFGSFFFKQKTAYEIKECDWRSDVCSSDLVPILESNSSRELFNVNDATTTVEAGWKNSSPFALVNWIPVARPFLCTMRRTQLPVRSSKFLRRASTGIRVLLGCAFAPTMQPYRWQWPQYWHAPRIMPSGFLYGSLRLAAGVG